ncbi:MAG: glycosyltransferase [Acidimicrobiales bacterium]
MGADERRPRVLHVLEALEGGTSRHLVDVVRHATGTDHVVAVPPQRVGGLTDERAVPALRDAGADIRFVTMHRTPWSFANAAALVTLRRLIRQVDPHAVHGHSSIGGMLARLAATGSGVPTVYTPNGITTVRAGVAVERGLRRRTDVFVAVSASEGELAVRLGVARREQVVVIPNGVSVEQPPAPLDLRAHLGMPADAPLVGTIARLVPQKAPEDFVSACERIGRAVPTARFVLIGGGQLEREVDDAVTRAGLDGRFTRIESLPGAAGVLGQLDVFALSSRFEGGPYAPLEAMRAETPVVLTDVVGSRDAVEDGVSGLVVPPGDPQALAQGVISLLGDAGRRHRMGKAGRERVETSFDVRSMGTALDDLYRRLASRTAPD